MLQVNKGSIEFLPVQVTDRLGGITTLDGYAVSFRITDVEEVEVITWASCNNEGMTVLPLIDATTLTDGKTYKLYIKIIISPEEPILGPFEFEVS